VNPGADYGEATTRHTGRPGQRQAHYAAHMDKFLPGCAHCFGLADPEQDSEEKARARGAEWFVNNYWWLNGHDWEKRGLTKEMVTETVQRPLEETPGMINVWCALTPGRTTQSMLAVADLKRTTTKSGGKDGTIVSVPIRFNDKFEDLLTLIRADEGRRARWLYRPNMRFGEALMFSNTHTPHTAMSLVDVPPAERISAEIRLVLPERSLFEASVATGSDAESSS